MGVFDSFSGTVGSTGSTLGSIGTQAMGTLGTIAGTAGRVSGAISSVQGASQSISALRSISLPPGGNPVARFAAGAALFNGAVNQAVGAVGQVAGAVGAIGGALGAVGGALGAASSIGGALGSIGGALGGLAGAFGGGSGDWRARITCALGELVFPYTPTIGISGGASYDEVPITHQNYSFFAYQNSKAETIQVSAPFYVEDAIQAQTWIKALNFLRASTKMFPDGNPPIIAKFNAYGDFVFKDVPVIVKSFSVDMPNGVDYISAGTSHVPIKSTISVTLQPIYSREKVKTFNLYAFVNGGSAGFV